MSEPKIRCPLPAEPQRFDVNDCPWNVIGFSWLVLTALLAEHLRADHGTIEPLIREQLRIGARHFDPTPGAPLDL